MTKIATPAKSDFEEQCQEIYGDSMPDVEHLKNIVNKELKKLKDYEDVSIAKE